MSLLIEQQQLVAVEAMEEYLAAQSEEPNLSLVEFSKRFDEERIALIEEDLKPLLLDFLDGKIELHEFKSKVDSLNKLYSYWGFKGIKGQMFFNMVVNVAEEVDDINDCIEELKAVFRLPANEHAASSKLKTFTSYVNRLRDAWVEAGNTRYGCPKLSSIPFFVTYFWQILDRDTWPIYYTASVHTMTDLNLWQPTGDIAGDYIKFKQIHEELVDLFTCQSGRKFTLYDVEHVFWYKGDNPYDPQKDGEEEDEEETTGQPVELDKLPQSYVPPIIGIIPKIAQNDPETRQAAERSGTSLEKAFEKHVNAAFKIMGYEATPLGQGKGRVPDGIAVSIDDSYAVIWDSKIRGNGYSMSTDDRTIREYITTQSRDIKKRRKLRNIYFMIVSSSFADDYDDTIRVIKMETDVNEVLLLEADALVAIVEAKLRDPLQITLGSDGIQRLFSNSGVITAQMVKECLE